MSELERKVRYHAQCYYEGHPEISDAEFDKLVEELHCTEPDNIILNMAGYGYYPKAGKKVKHIYGGMQSISRKPRSIDGIPKNFKNVRLTPKYDGLSCGVYIKDGKIDYAATRGNGDIGIDITDKIERILHNKLKASGFTGAIRGELLISRENWKEFVKKHPESEGKSPRNSATGIINRDYVDDDIKYIDFHPYKIIATSDLLPYSEAKADACQILNGINYMFETYEDHILCSAKDLSQEYLKDLFDRYNELFPCDGIVITNNTVISRDGILEYDEVAFKFNTDTEVTTVVGIDWNRTRTGKLIPTILVDPIDLGGATIRRCTGFNAQFIRDNKIGYGAEVTIMRSGEVIPDLQNVVTPAFEADIPKVCPICGKELTWNGVHLECQNSECDGVDESDLYHWIWILAPVHGLGYSILKDFLNHTQIKCIEDLYTKHPILDGTSATAKKLAEMWYKLHEDKINFESALVALNIPRLGWKSAQKICEDEDLVKEIIDSCEDKGLLTSTMLKLRSIVGQATLDSIMSNLLRIERLKFIKDRIILNVPKSEVIIQQNGEVVITGKLETCKRSDFEKIIVDAGYTLASAVKSGIKYLITNTPNSGSSKNKKANELGIQKITEKEFLEMIGYEK